MAEEVLSPEAKFEAAVAKHIGEEPPADDVLNDPDARHVAKDEPQEAAQEEQVAEETVEPAVAEEVAPVDESEVDLDGEVFKLPKKVADAVLKNKDYTQKTQEVASIRRIVEDQKQYMEAAAAIHEQTTEVRQQLSSLEVQAKQLADLNWGELWQSDPARAGPLHAYRTTLQEQIAAKRGELQGAEQRAAQAFQAHKAKQLELGQAELERRLGGKKLADVRSDLAQAAQRYGFGESEMMSPAAMHALARAMEMDRLQASAPAVAKKVAQAKPMQAPAARSSQTAANVSAVDALKAKAIKSGRSEDAESFLARRIAERAKRQ